MADAQVPGFKPSLESSSNWINIVIGGVSALGGLPLISKMLTGIVQDDRTIYGTVINGLGIVCFAWITVTLIKVIGSRASNVESAFLTAHGPYATTEAPNRAVELEVAPPG